MRADAVINPDGCLRLSTGDIVRTDITTYFRQKIYAAIMSMPPSVVSGFNITHTDTVETAIRQYLRTKLLKDPDIKPETVEITAEPNGSPQGIKIAIGLSVTAPDGTPVQASANLDYSIAGGALLTVDFSPAWLETLDQWERRDIIHLVEITEHTNEVKLPLRPLPLDFQPGTYQTASPIVLRRDSAGTTITPVDGTFSITTIPNRSIYPISRSISGFVDKVDCIIEAELDEETDNRSIQLINGELSLVLRSPEAGPITGTYTTIQAVQTTQTFRISDPLARQHVFELRKIRGSYTAVFPKTVAPGNYMIQYTGIAEVF